MSSMNSSQDSSKIPSGSSSTVGRDPCWAFGEKVTSNDTNRIRCIYCKQIVNGGITRLKHHLAGIRGNVKACLMVPSDVKEKVGGYLNSAQATKKFKTERLQTALDDVVVGGGDSEKEEAMQRSLYSGVGTKGPMDQFVQPEPAESSKRLQTTIDSKCKKKARDDACLFIARWAYETGIPFNALYATSFQQALHAVGQCGPGMKGPTPYEMREKFLKMEVERTKEMLVQFTQTCRVHGCSILTDAWTDRKGRSIMNIMVHTIAGVAFWLSKNVSSSTHDGKFIFDFVDEAIASPDGPREENIVQIVTDNASNNMAASRLMALKRPRIFWTPCAAHTVNLLLQDIARIKQIKNAIAMGRQLSVFIYGHTISLDMFRETTKDLDSHDLVRPGVTRFATTFLSLQSIHEKKRHLREMFSSARWDATKLSGSEAGKQATTTVLGGTFWQNVELAILVFAPLVKVLRRADGDTPSMGWLYGDMKKAREEVAAALEFKESKYLPMWKLIDRRVETKMSNPLQLTGYLLNPFFYYPNREEIDEDPKFMGGFIECLTKMYSHDIAMQDAITAEVEVYQLEQGAFSRDIAKRQRLLPEFNPAHWWKFYGIETPKLRNMAMKILNLTTSSSGCERNWSTFEMIHSKKRNRLESKRLNDLVFVKFNSKLKSKYSDPSRDPLSAKSIDEGKVTEWLAGPTDDGEDDDDDEVFSGEGLTWTQIGDMVDADVSTRRSVRPAIKQTYKAKTKGKRRLSERDEDANSEEDIDDDALVFYPSEGYPTDEEP